MKKLYLLILVALLSVGYAQAQSNIKYQGEFDAGYTIGVGEFAAAGRINVHTIHGAKFGNHFSAGLGVGVDIYHAPAGYSSDVMVPIYLNLKGFLLPKRISPFVSMDLGVGIGASTSMQGLSGFYCSPAIGVQAGRFKAQIGYNLQQISEYGITLNFSGVQFKVGLMF